MSERERAHEALDRLSALLDEESGEIRARNEKLREDKDDQQLEEAGILLRGAQVGETRATLFTRVRVCFRPAAHKKAHLEHFDVRPGSVVHVRARGDDDRPAMGASGVVVTRKPGRLEVVFDEPPDFDTHAVDLIRVDDEVTLRRLREGLADCKAAQGRAEDLIAVVLGVRAPAPVKVGTWTPLDDKLNEAQRNACAKALFAPDLSLIHGPPGTGKTRVVTELIRQSVARGERVLALCASNAAVDHVALSLLEHEPKMALARAGHPARAHVGLHEHTLAGLTDDHELRKISRRLFNEAHDLLRNARRRSDRGREAYKREREARVEAGRLFADARRLERQAVDEVMRKTRVLCGTLTGFRSSLPDEAEFDVLVVDEASQALTPALLLGVARAGRVVLAGDHKQLPPTVISPRAAKGGLSETAFDQAMMRDDAPGFSEMLVVQHRMNEALMKFSSARFYGDALVAHDDVRARTLADIDVDASALLDPARVLEFIDTAGSGFEERAPDPGSMSQMNEGEVRVVEAVLGALTAGGASPEDIGVISPYAAQVARISDAVFALVEGGLEIDSVDGFQGREKEIIVLSLVRSNALSEVGFVKDARRLNVALTRAKRKLVVVGDSATLSSDETLRAFIDHAIAAEQHRSVFEFGLV